MKIDRFEDIVAWQKSEDLCVLIYQLFKDNRDYGFKDQIQRAAVSIMNNIAEGFERGTNKDFRHFLYVAKASCAEVRSMLYLARKLGYISEKDFEKSMALSLEVVKLLSGFIKTL